MEKKQCWTEQWLDQRAMKLSTSELRENTQLNVTALYAFSRAWDAEPKKLISHKISLVRVILVC